MSVKQLSSTKRAGEVTCSETWQTLSRMAWNWKPRGRHAIRTPRKWWWEQV